MEGRPGTTQPIEGALSEQSRYRPFGLHWLDSALHETLLPGSPWEQVHARISEALARSLEADLDGSEEKREMILELLGPQFVHRYMKGVMFRPEVLDPAVFAAENKKLLQRATQVLLKEKLDLILREQGFTSLTGNRPTPVMGGETPNNNAENQWGSNLQEFIDHARGIFETGLERHLVIHERQRPSETEDFLKPKREANLSSRISDHLSKSLIAILQRDPSRLDAVCQTLSGKQLPTVLRSYIWVEILLKLVNDTETGKEKLSETSLRKRFAKAVSKGKVEMKISRATECPIGGLIETAVKEKFDTRPCMVAHRLDEVQRRMRDALNVVYTYNRSYEPFLIDWLFPLLQAFQENQWKEEHPYELAMYLDLLQTYAFPKWPEIFAIAEQVMSRLKSVDIKLYSHLQHCAVSNVKVDPQDFMVHLISAEKKKAAALSWSTSFDGRGNSSLSAAKAPEELLASPLIFLRKWIGEGFVCILNCQAVMYIWDQCFLERWDRKVLEDVSLSLLVLLKEKFLKAEDYHQMKQVFLEEPSMLLTLDIVKTYRRIHSSQLPRETPDIARKSADIPQEPIPTTPEQDPSPTPKQDPSPTPEPEPEPEQASSQSRPATPQQEQHQLRRAGLSNIRLNLIWNLTKTQLADFEMDKLIVSAMLAVSDKKLQVKEIKDCVKISSVAKDAWSRVKDKMSNKSPQQEKFFVSTSNVIFSPEELELLRYSRELKPQVVMRISYKTVTTNEDGSEQESEDPIGWALIPVYKLLETPSSGDNIEDGTAHQISTWGVCTEDQTIPLYYGDVPDDVMAEGAMKEFAAEDLLREGSEVRLKVFDPNESPWLQHNPSLKDEKEEIPADQGFDLYVDGVRFLPDNATICKVTGRVLRPSSPDRPDIIATPILNSSSRCPNFKYRYTIPTAEETNLVMFRMYTVDKVTRAAVVVGAAVLEMYTGNESKKLNVGGFQLKIHSGMPIGDLSANSMAKLPYIPACTLLVRLLPRSEEFVPAPDYGSAYYNSDSCRPTTSELRVIAHYKRSKAWPATLDVAIQKLRLQENETEELTDDELTTWAMDRLNVKKQSGPNAKKAPEPLDLLRCVDYDMEEGLYVSVLAAKAIRGEGKYTNVVARILPGREITQGKETVDPADEECFLIQDIKSSSQQNAPEFKAPPKKLYPTYNTQSVLLLQLIGLKVTYKPDPSDQGPGTMFGEDGTEPVSLKPTSRLGWCALPLFAKGCVAQGSYTLPIFQDRGNFSFLKELSEAPDLFDWLVSAMKQSHIMLEPNYPSVIVSLWDGHFEKSETVLLPTVDRFLNVENLQTFKTAADSAKGQPISDFILQSLPTEIQKEGVLSEMYWREEERFQEVMRTTFKEIIDKMEPTLGQNDEASNE